MLTNEEQKRYARQMTLEDLGVDGQEKLRNASVLVVGVGGLGCPVLQYLTSSGVGTIGIADQDMVSASNLHRQVLYGPADIGAPKVDVAAERVGTMNEFVEVQVHSIFVDASNALDLLAPYDIVVDATDNFATRYCLNDACTILGKPLVYGSILRYEGQVTVFNYQSGPTYRCLFPEPPEPGTVPSCAEAGVIGVLPGIIGTLQANEVIKIITGIGKVLSGTMLVLDTRSMQASSIYFERNEAEIEKIINLKDKFEEQDYEAFCMGTTTMKSLTAEELREKLANNEDIQIIDVREPYEYDEVNMKGENIPMGEILNHLDQISKDKPVVVHCRSGQRSGMVISQLEGEHGFENLYNLSGGILAWVDSQPQE